MRKSSSSLSLYMSSGFFKTVRHFSTDCWLATSKSAFESGLVFPKQNCTIYKWPWVVNEWKQLNFDSTSVLFKYCWILCLNIFFCSYTVTTVNLFILRRPIPWLNKHCIFKLFKKTVDKKVHISSSLFDNT